MKKHFFLGALTLSSIVYSQVGINTQYPKATLDVVASPDNTSLIDGLIAPRLKGVELKNKDNNYNSDQDAAIIYITEPLTVNQTTSKTSNVLSTGYYYFDKNIDGGKWIKLQGNYDYKEPWYVQSTSNYAISNTDNIYQMGTVSIGKNSAYKSSHLDVNGSVRFGTGHMGEVGENSITSGQNNEASGNSSIAIGLNNKATNNRSLAIGNENIASGSSSAAFGFKNISSGLQSFAAGSNNIVTGERAVVFGDANINNGYGSFVAGGNNELSNNHSGIIGSENIVTQDHSVVFGQKNEATGRHSSVIGGYLNKSTNQYSISGGYGSTASGDMSFAFGSTVVASGWGSVVFGQESIAQGRGAFAQGWGVHALNDGEAVFGKFNKKENSANGSIFQIGDGTDYDDANQSSIFVVMTEGVPGDGWVAIGSGTDVATRHDSETKLRVYGTIRTTGANYPDYVFENYLDGKSEINKNYKFKSIYEVEKFIKENKHLPGVTSIKQLEKTKNGYSFDITNLSTQTLEKVEELYLHTIEQQKQIDELKDVVKQQQNQIYMLLNK